MLREGFRAVGNISLQWLPTHLQVTDPLTKTMERDILVSFFNSRDISLWPRRFPRTGPPQKVFDRCVAAKQVQLAAFGFFFLVNSSDPSICFFVLHSNLSSSQHRAYQFLLMFQLFPCANGARIVLESRSTQASPRVDVDETLVG